MILTCPSCGTQYVVKDGAIPPGGRQVRCASCKHSWHEDAPDGDQFSDIPAAPDEAIQGDPGPETDTSSPGEVSPADERSDEYDDDASFAEAAMIDPSSGPAIEERAYEEALIEGEPAAVEPSAVEQVGQDSPGAGYDAAPEPADDEFSPFSPVEEDYDEGRRSPLLTILLIVVLVAALAAAFWFFAPDAWKMRLGLAAAGASPLALVTTHMDRQRLASGQETLNVTGRVINNTGKQQDVPPLQAQLRSRSGKLVYQWTIAPPAATLPAGGSASFNSTEVSVPPGGDELTISVGPPSA